MKPRIRIVKNGPYLVSGNVPLRKARILEKQDILCIETSEPLPTQETYGLCRCGNTKTPPFCDGSHQHCGFDGTETAGFSHYDDRSERIEGTALDLWDDGRCSFARFCHRENGDAWTLVEESDNPELCQEAIEAAMYCPSGRLVAMDKNGMPYEPNYPPEILVSEDLEEGVSSPLYVRGGIPIESSCGEMYEVRNRVALCRCGNSSNKPFCDATHLEIHFNDGSFDPE